MNRRLSLLAAVLAILPAHDALAAGVTVQSFNSMAEFQASPLYTFINGAPGGAAQTKARGVRALKQGSADVPTASAGTLNNSAVTSEVLAAATDIPDCLSGNTTSSFYNKKFISLGTETGGAAPYLTLDIVPAFTTASGGFNGYDIVILDLGKNLASGTGNGNGEGTTFAVELVSQGQFFTIGSITNSGGNFVNAILLDLTGIPGVPATIDAVRLVDTTGSGVSANGTIDVDGVLTLNPAATTATRGTTWGQLKSAYR
jgi:hypothetical protein